jgi:hypothetical protein
MSDTVTSPVPADQSSADLFNNLGRFWNRLYEDAAFIRQYCRGSSLAAAQVYIDFLEALNSLGVATIPSFHRERWIPILLKRSERNSGKAASFYIGAPEVNIGPQEDNTYRDGQIFSIGGNLVRDNFVVYPINGNVPDTGVYKLCSRIWEPGKVLVRNIDYYVSGGCIVFRSQEDPFSAANLKSWQNRTISGTDTGDMEVLLWGADALFDQKFVQNSFGSAMQYTGTTGEYYDTVVKELWNLKVSGADVATVNRTFNKVMGLPVAETEGENVIDIVDNLDGTRLVVTDVSPQPYVILANQTLLPHIRKGTVLKKWEPLTDTVVVYHARDPVNTISRLADRFTGIALSTPLIYAPGMVSGVTVGNIKTPLEYAGKLNTSGKHVFRYAMGGSDADQTTYWNYVWNQWSADSSGVSMEDAMSDYIVNTIYRTYDAGDYYPLGYNPQVPDLLVPKAQLTVGSLRPFEFITTNITRDNLTVAVVDFAGLPEYIRSLEPLSLTRKMMPSHAYTMYIAEMENPDDQVQLDAGTETFSPARMRIMIETAGMVGGGLTEAANLTYKDSKPIIRQVRRCRW